MSFLDERREYPYNKVFVNSIDFNNDRNKVQNLIHNQIDRFVARSLFIDVQPILATENLVPQHFQTFEFPNIRHNK